MLVSRSQAEKQRVSFLIIVKNMNFQKCQLFLSSFLLVSKIVQSETIPEILKIPKFIEKTILTLPTSKISTTSSSFEDVFLSKIFYDLRHEIYSHFKDIQDDYVLSHERFFLNQSEYRVAPEVESFCKERARMDPEHNHLWKKMRFIQNELQRYFGFLKIFNLDDLPFLCPINDESQLTIFGETLKIAAVYIQGAMVMEKSIKCLKDMRKARITDVSLDLNREYLENRLKYLQNVSTDFIRNSKDSWTCSEDREVSGNNYTARTFKAVCTDPVFADKDKFVSNAKFEMINEILYIRIEQAELTIGGILNGSTTEWKAAQKCSESGLTVFQMEDPTYLDDIKVAGHLLVGFQLIKIQNHWKLGVAMRPIPWEIIGQNIKEENSDLEETKLYGESIFYEKSKADVNRTEFQFSGQKMKNLRSNQNFSNIKTDSGQIEGLPLIDTQEMRKTFYVPFSGAGLFVKPTTGLLTLKLLPYKLWKFVSYATELHNSHELSNADLIMLRNSLK